MDKKLKKYIKENYIKPKKNKKLSKGFCRSFSKGSFEYDSACECKEFERFQKLADDGIDFEKDLQETFVQHLFKIIDQKGWKDSDVYKKANLDRKLFSKIRSNINYRPAKNTVLALALALELDLDETKSFLEKAGFALSRSILSDVIVEYYIINKQYDIFEINQTLNEYKLQLLGSGM